MMPQPVLTSSTLAAPGVYLDWYSSPRIVGYRLTEMNAGVEKAWASLVAKTLTDWDLETPYLALHDLSARHVVLPYMRSSSTLLTVAVTTAPSEAVRQIITDSRFRARVAILVNNEVSGYLVNTLSQLELMKKSRQSVMYAIYEDITTALGWLAHG